jgi:hypothetical protein
MSTSALGRTAVAVPRAAVAERVWPTVLAALLLSRAVVWVAAVIALLSSPPGAGVVAIFDPHGLTHPFSSLLLNRLVAPAARYDSVWYLGIAQHGYFSAQSRAFFPLYPLAISVVSAVTGTPLLAGLIISLACFAGSLALLYRLTRLDFDARVARLAVWLLALFPMSLYFSAVYTESLFSVLSLGAIYAARRERWAVAGICAGLAAAARSDGFVLILPLAWIYLWGPRATLRSVAAALRSPRRWRAVAGPRLAWTGLAPLGLVAYLLYCAFSGASFTAPFHAAAHFWGRPFRGPFSEIWIALRQLPGDISHLISGHQVRLFDQDDPLNWTADNVIDVAWLIPLLTCLVIAWRRLPRVYVLYTLAIVVASASNPSPLEPMMSFARYVMPAFPLFIAAAVALADRAWLRWLVLAASTAGLAFFSALWGIWAWVA